MLMFMVSVCSSTQVWRGNIFGCNMTWSEEDAIFQRIAHFMMGLGIFGVFYFIQECSNVIDQIKGLSLYDASWWTCRQCHLWVSNHNSLHIKIFIELL